MASSRSRCALPFPLLHVPPYQASDHAARFVPKIVKNGDRDLLRTVIWWCIRARREEYVEVRTNERVQIAFPFVVEQVLEDLKGWCGPEIEQMSDLPAKSSVN